jgi:hypothetical protein
MKDLLQTKIIDKILEYKPDAVSTIDFMRHVFNTHTRIISAYRAKNDLIVPGGMMDENFQPEVKQNNGKYRRAKRHALMWVRCDLIHPNRIEVEHLNKIFIMTRPEWESFKRLLKLVPKSEEI